MLAFLLVSVWAKDLGYITGSIYDSQTGEPLPGVTIMIEGGKTGTYSDLDGHFTLKNLEPGTYTLIFSLIGYKQSKDSVMVKSFVELEPVLLDPEAIEVEGIEVKAKKVSHTEAALLQMQRKAPTINDGISAEQIAKSPDSDAAGALKRVTGVTVVDGKYVYVRGMGERYSNTLLNGTPLPSPEPRKRVIPMDLIPANLLENVITTKTFTSDQQGNFSGGSVRLNTKEFPEKLIFKLSASGGWNTQTTGNTFYQAPGGNRDWLGIDDGSRDIPDLVNQVANGGGNPVPAHSNEEIAQSFRWNVWDGKPRKAPANQSYSLSIGNQVGFLEKPLGYVFSLTYSNKYSSQKEKQNFYNSSSQGIGVRSYWDIEKDVFSVLWGSILNLSYKPHPFHKLRLNSTYTRSAEDKVRWLAGWYEDWLWLESSVSWVEQSLIHFTLSGEHELPAYLNSHLDWSASYGKANWKEPDKCWLLWDDTTPDSPDTVYSLEDQKTSKYRRWGQTDDINYSFSLDWTKNFTQWSGLPARFKLGGSIERMDRDELFFYAKVLVRSDPWTFQGRPADQTIIPPEDWRFVDRQDNWGDNRITAGYIQFDTPVLESLRMIAGARVEGTDLEFIYNPVGQPDERKIVKKEHTDWLPSINLTYNINDETNIRLAMAKTITRPEYFELLAREDQEIFENLKNFGNPELDHTRIYNYDAKWEFYPRPGEVLAVSFFYKKFTSPIEYVYEMMGTPTLKPINVEGARNYGIEFEVRKQFDFLWRRLSDFSINANYTLIQSEVEIGDAGLSTFKLTNKEGALIGQSPYVLNFTLGYESDRGTSARILFNRFGRRIAYRGNMGNPDIVEQSSSKLDLTWEQKFLSSWGLKLNASNLLDSKVKFDQAGLLWREYKEGRSFSLGFSYSI
jgi:outer membrane receptor protein involved in Fe transport